jgi:RNA-directed DNA polymerase
MGREFHVRFREGLGVRFPRATRLVVLHPDEGVIRECQAIAQEWLKGMGLELKPSKTRIGHTLREVDGRSGFDFLGFTIRQFPVGKYHSGKGSHGSTLGFKTIITPSKEKVKVHQDRLAELVEAMKGAPQKELIKALNPRIKGWCNYYRTVCSKKIFSDVDHRLHQLLRCWAERRHKEKGSHWITRKYWQMPGWTFGPQKGPTLSRHSKTKIIRHVKVEGVRSPFDGDWKYWASRQAYYPGVSCWLAMVLKRQGGKCARCGMMFMPEDLIEVHHVKREDKRTGQLEALHRHCHDSVHGSSEAIDLEESISDKD